VRAGGNLDFVEPALNDLVLTGCAVGGAPEVVKWSGTATKDTGSRSDPDRIRGQHRFPGSAGDKVRLFDRDSPGSEIENDIVTAALRHSHKSSRERSGVDRHRCPTARTFLAFTQSCIEITKNGLAPVEAKPTALFGIRTTAFDFSREVHPV
jgi:hypothetical protein